MTLKILVAGAGIGGLAAAAALCRQGLDVTVIEQAPLLGEVGAGLQVSPNAVRVLRGLGLEEQVTRIASAPEAFSAYDWDSGEELYRTPIAGTHQRLYGAGYYQIHRADLHSMLAASVPADRVRLGTKIIDAGQDENQAWLRLDSGERLEADVLIGADGIRSVVRKAVGPAPEPHYTGMTAFRGLIPAAAVPPSIDRVAANWLGPRGHVVHYHLRGFDILNIVAIMEVEDWTEESWSLPVEKQEMLSLFEGWNPTIRHLLSHIEKPFRWGLYGREPTQLWGSGRITLLGDSVHPMVPFLGQGAAMAMEDGYVLGGLLGKLRHRPVDALRKYEALRRPRANRVQQSSLDRAATIHEADPVKRAERNRLYAQMSKANPEQTMHKAEWIYAYDVEADIASA